jgi:hypothetical protein
VIRRCDTFSVKLVLFHAPPTPAGQYARLLDLLRLLPGRSRRAPGGAHDGCQRGGAWRNLCPVPPPTARQNRCCRFTRRPARYPVGRGPATAGRERSSARAGPFRTADARVPRRPRRPAHYLQLRHPRALRAAASWWTASRPLRLLAGRSRRAPGGVHDDAGAGGAGRIAVRRHLPAAKPSQSCLFRPGSRSLRGGRRPGDRGLRASIRGHPHEPDQTGPD